MWDKENIPLYVPVEAIEIYNKYVIIITLVNEEKGEME